MNDNAVFSDIREHRKPGAVGWFFLRDLNAVDSERDELPRARLNSILGCIGNGEF